MTEQLVLVPVDPPRLTPIRLPIREIDIGLSPPLDSGFVESIKRFGILQPPVVRLRGDIAHIVDGRRRVWAKVRTLEAHENPRIDCLQLTGDAAPEVLALMLNDQRSTNPVSDLAAIESLIDKGASEHDIQQATGMAIPTIRKRMSLKRLCWRWREKFNDGRVPVTIAEALAKLPEATQEELYCIWLNQDGKITHKDIRAAKMVRAQGVTAQLPDELFRLEPIHRPNQPSVLETARMIAIRDKGVLDMLAPLDGPPTDNWYEIARLALHHLIESAPDGRPQWIISTLTDAVEHLADIAESQTPGFLAPEERVDVSDVVPEVIVPYDEGGETFEANDDYVVDVEPPREINDDLLSL